jgi:ADP-heptose:LPS heptosyltransferase
MQLQTILPKAKFVLLRGIMWTLSAVVSRSRGRKRAPARDDVDRIGAMHFGGIGDMVLTTAALRELSHAFPRARFTIVCSSEPNARFLSEFPFVEEVIAFDVYALDTRGVLRKRFWTELLAVVSRLRSKRLSLLVNFHTPFLIDWFLIEFLLIAFSRARFAVGANPAYLRSRSVYHRWISEDRLNAMHCKDFFLDIIGLTGVQPRNRETTFPVRAEDVAQARALLGTREAIAVIHPGGSSPHNHWPIERYAKISCALSRRNLQVVVVGSALDRDRGASISRVDPSARNLAGRTTLSQTAALIALAAIFIGNDSSQFHVAVALNTPAVGLIGGGAPRFHMYSRENVRVIRKRVDCAPCSDRICRSMECLKLIQVSDVIEAVDGLLATSGSQAQASMAAAANG